jgi:hypothetical protein
MGAPSNSWSPSGRTIRSGAGSKKRVVEPSAGAGAGLDVPPQGEDPRRRPRERRDRATDRAVADDPDGQLAKLDALERLPSARAGARRAGAAGGREDDIRRSAIGQVNAGAC